MGQIGRELRWGIHYGKSYVGGTGREGEAYGRGRTKGSRTKGGPTRRVDANGIERRNGEQAAVAEEMADVENLAAENGQRGTQRAIRIAGGAPIRSSWMCLESQRATSE